MKTSESITNEFFNLITRTGRYIFHRSAFRKLNIQHTRIFRKHYRKFCRWSNSNQKYTEYFGCKFKLPEDDVTIVPTLLAGDYERNELFMLQRLLKNKNTFIDVGANIGLFSIIGAGVMNENATVISFEPEINNIKLLHENIKLNGLENIIVEQCLVGESDKNNVKLYIAHNSGTHSTFAKTNKYVELKQVSLDSYFYQNKITPDVIKIDVEGAETSVFQGLKNTLDKKPTIMFECSFKNFEVNKEGIDILKKLENLYDGFYVISNKNLKNTKKISLDELRKNYYSNVLLTDRP